MRSIDLGAVLQPPRLPGSQMIPAEQAVRTLLALKLLGIKEKVMSWIGSTRASPFLHTKRNTRWIWRQERL